MRQRRLTYIEAQELCEVDGFDVAELILVSEDGVDPLGDRDAWCQISIINLAERHAVLVDKEMKVLNEHVLSL